MDYLKKLGKELGDDKATTLAAAQAYYYMLAIFPLLILLLTILPYLNINPDQVTMFIEDTLPPELASTFTDNIVNLVTTPRGGLLTLGLLGTLWSASNAVNAFILAVNQAYDVEENRSFIKKTILRLVLTLGAIIAIAVALALPIFGGVIINALVDATGLSAGSTTLLHVLRWVISIVVISLVLAAMYHFGPDEQFPFKEVLVGAIVATVLWQVVSLLFSFYVSNFGNYTATYGSLGGVIILLLWFFLTGLILVIGAEINAMNHKRKKIERQNVKNQPAQVTEPKTE
ncbi:YihY/virulence factor BrkB family protein [Planococcus lenghuensis]|uniref:Ribonuclease n=1 Tax=Planococcus lenghuensis TaxID=2213202 RepID=A0A1Q2L1Z1_9BACL|nr:YihY/virulence factor BrkB family protein [Planococcus lenghuensis]AQQ54433.1 ribonuclease [Planococcus lenghuensis]